MLIRVILILFLALAPLSTFGADAFFPLQDVKPGMHGIGRTVFHGSQIEEFQVEVLGVLQNSGPRQSIILARLSGGPLAETGVLQGMSGSPVYIEGKLVGAVALGFPFSKEPIAGIQPIEQMINGTESLDQAGAPPFRSYAEVAAAERHGFGLPASEPNSAFSSPLRTIAAPLALGGFTEAALRTFSTGLRALGFDAQQGAGTGSPTSSTYTGTVQPGSMISVQLMTGDLNISADGTVTHVDGKKIYAFGHRFLTTGTTDLPFARAEVVALLPSTNTSFKISAPRELVGSLVSDRSTAVRGEIGRAAHMLPLEVTVDGAMGQHSYKIQIVNDRLLTPFLTQMALFTVLDSTERMAGAGSLRVDGKVEFEGNAPALDLANSFSADTNVVLQATMNLAVPLAYVLQTGFRDLRPKRISFKVHATEQKRELAIDQIWLSQREARPGETVTLNCVLSGENGIQVQKAAQYRVPVGSPTGRLFFTVSDANILNFGDLAGLTPSSVRSPGQLIDILNLMRPNDKAYVRIWRQQPSFSLPGADLTDPPPSVALVLSKSSSSVGGAGLAVSSGAKIGELQIPAGDYVITGSKTVQLDIKE
jgi:hypothetical protein